MSENLFSPSWYRVEAVKPRLREHVVIHRHEYRGQAWYVLYNQSNSRSHRFRPAGYYLIGLMDGERTVQAIWDAGNTELGDDAPTQDEFIKLLAQLHGADALQSDAPPDTLELLRRHQRHERMKWKQRLWSPLAIRFPLLDPEAFLRRTLPVVAPLFSWFGVVIWLVVVGTGLILAGMHWADLTENVVDRILAPQNLLALWIIYPVVKGLHELGHAYATKVWGGEVHEIGIMLLVLMPIPYVDASAAWAFPDKRKRMVVGAAGIAVELFLGALAMFVWVSAEPGVVRSIAYTVMLIGGVSTLLFNGNPLLRFDGYYVLADAVEIPNLGNRATKYIGYLLQRYLFGVRDATSPVTARGERWWFVFYGLAAFAYRMFIMFTIVLFVAGKFFVIGVVLALWAVVTQLMVPLAKHIAFLFSSPHLRRNRPRAVLATIVVLGLITVGLFLVPAPLSTHVEGVVWPPDQSQVRSETDGFVKRVVSAERVPVRRNDALVETDDPLLRAEVAVLEAQVRELDARITSSLLEDRVRAGLLREELGIIEASLVRARERVASLTVRSPTDGVFIAPSVQNLPGQYIRQGALIGYVLEPAAMTARVVVGQDQVGLVRGRTRAISVMLHDWGGRPMEAQLKRALPGGTDRLPTPVLASAGGGVIAIDMRDPNSLKTLEKVFQYELTLPYELRSAPIGARIQVRFDHGTEPLAQQWYRDLRQLFLRRFGV